MIIGKIKDEPAFPAFEYHAGYGQMMAVGGMTLRDYFAAKALVTRGFKVRPYDETDEVAKDCYRMADAMLKARQA